MIQTQFGIEMQFVSSDGFISIADDVRASSAVFTWGITGIGPTARVAGTGMASFTLDNSQANSAGTLGYYSPDNDGVRAGFGIGTPFMVKVTDTPTSDTSDDVTTYKLFYVTDISPTPGKYLERSVQIGGADYIDKMSTQYADALNVATTSRTDEGLVTLYSIMPVAPLATWSSTGTDTFGYIFQDVDGKKTTIYNIAQRLVQSDFGYIYCDGDSDNGETMVYQTRQDRLPTTSCVTLNDTMSGLTLQHSAGNVYNHITTISYPLDISSSTTSDAEILYDLKNEIALVSGTTYNYTFRYRDPNAQGNTIHLYPGSGIAPTSDEYTVFTATGGGGSEITTDVAVTVTYYADHADVVILNSNASTGYLNKLELKGQTIRLYDPSETVASESSDNLTAYGKRPLRYALPYQDNPNTAKDMADLLLAKWGTPRSQLESVDFYPNRDQTLYSAAVNCGIGDKITITETVTGISYDFNINGVEWTFTPGAGGKPVWKVKWFLEYGTTAQYWYLGVAGFGELGETTYLGF